VTPFELRPLAIGELLDRVFTIYRRHLSTFVGIMAVPSLFNLALALSILILQHMNGGQLFQPPAPGRPFNPDAILKPALQIVGVSMAFLAVYWVVYMMALGAATTVVAEIYAGRDIAIGAAYGKARGQLGRLLLLAILWVLMIVAPGVLFVGVGAGIAAAARSPVLLALFLIFGMIAFFILAIIMFLRYAVSAPALMLERVSAWGAMQRSAVLTRGFLGRVFLTFLVASLMAYTAALLLQMPFQLAAAIAGPLTMAGFWLSLVGAVSGTIGHTLTAPVLVIGVAVLYYDFRVRKEALDLQMMMSTLDTPGDGLPMPPPSPALPR
jgi:hypothetical protein